MSESKSEDTLRPVSMILPDGVSADEALAALALVTRMALLPPEARYVLVPAGKFVRGGIATDRLDLAAVPEMKIRRGGVQFPPADWLEGTRIVQTGGWCAPSEDVRGWPIADPGDMAAPEPEPVPSCDGVNHRWERFSTGACHECGHSQPGRRVLECEACPATLNENADGLPAGHFDRLWKAAT